MTDLSFVTTAEMIHELENRHDAFVYAGLQLEPGDSQHRYVRGWSGGCLLCRGLLDLLDRRVKQAMDEMDEIDADHPQGEEFNVDED
jgi:hypothetical protein